MKRQLLQGIVLISALMLYAHSLSAHSKPRFSHKGIKAALGFGNVDMPSSTNSGEHEAGMLSLGYGFSERSTLWLSLIGTDNDSRSATRMVTEFGGVELASV